MAKILNTKKLADSIREYSSGLVEDLESDGKTTGLCVIRVGEEPSDIAYEKRIRDYSDSIGINTHFLRIAVEVVEDKLGELIDDVNSDMGIDGVLIFRPLPGQMDEDILKEIVMPFKDIDGVTSNSISMVTSTPMKTEEEIMPSWLGSGFPPCTAEACMMILDSYGIDPAGKRAVVVGRSEVIGKPIAFMLLNRDATVTICHSKTEDLEEITKDADILIVATGKPGSIGREHVSPGQTVIDVGIHVEPDGKICGDVDFDEVEPIVENITPVPGGVGGLTTALLIKHVVDASLRFMIIENEFEEDDEDEDYYDPSKPIDDDGLEIRGKVIKFNQPKKDN